MTTLLIVAETTQDGSGCRAVFPDLPGLCVQAPDLSELLVTARRSVLAQLQSLSDKGEGWPQITPIQDLTASPGAILILVDVSVDDPPVRVNISIGERLLERIDAAAEARSMTRSGFIAHAARVSLGERVLGERANGGADFDEFGRKLQDEFTSLGQRINDSIGPDSAFSRRMNELDEMLYDGVRKAADGVSAAMTRRRQKTAADDARAADAQPTNSETQS